MDSDQLIQAHVFISGRVQGVFFRASTRSKANQLRIRGWVRNLSDGRVEALFQGDADDVQKVIEWAHEGPSAARVEKVEVKEKKKIKGDDLLEGFEIRY